MTAPAASPDVFGAIAEPRRRAIIELLACEGEQGVGAIVIATGSPQPAVSKQLAVLRDAGVVAVRRRGRERLYSLNAEGLRAVHEWTKTFERYWSHQAERIKRRAERITAQQTAAHQPPEESEA